MDDRTILERYPLPLARGYRRYRNAAEIRERHDAAYYLFEIYLKYGASLTIARYLAGDGRDHRVNAALKGLARPSLGEWIRFLRECLRFLNEQGEPDGAIRALAALLEEKESRWAAVVRLYNDLRSFRTGRPSERDTVSLMLLLQELVPYRNRTIGHGAPLGREHYEAVGASLGEAFVELLDHSPFLTARSLVVFDSVQVEEGSRIECGVVEYMSDRPVRRRRPHSIPYGRQAPCKDTLYVLSEEGDLLALDPLLIPYREDVYFLNEAGGTPDYLSYATGEHHTPSNVGGAQQELFERILGYGVDETRLSRIGEDVAPAPAEAPSEGGNERQLGDYRIVRELGRGAMGAVFEAIQESLGRRVALKVLPGTFALDPKRLERFRREARATARIHHPNIVPVYEVGEAGGSHYYAMEYIDGPSLDRVIAEACAAAQEKKKSTKDTSTANPEYIAHTVGQVAALADGVQQAHELGLIHRDVKPSNILVDSGGRYILVDFGLVKEEAAQTLTRSGEMVGTLVYMSPEQVSRRPVDARSDVYSLGATLYELLTLRGPYEGDSEHVVQNAILFKEPFPPRKLNPRLNRDLETIILHAVEKDPDRRYPSAADFAADLRRFLRYEPIRAKPQSPLTRILRRARKHKTKVAAAAALLVLLVVVALLGIVTWANRREQAQRRYEDDVRRAAMIMEGGHLTFREAIKEGSNVAVDYFFFSENPAFRPSASSLNPIESAIEILREAVDLCEERPEARYHLARALVRLEEQEDSGAGRREALDQLNRTIEDNPDFVPARLLREILSGESHRQNGTEDGPAGVWAPHWRDAIRARERDDWAEVARACNELLTLEEERGGELFLGSSIETLMGLGVALYQSEKYDEAIGVFWRAHDRWQGSPEPPLLLGKIHLKRGNKEAAERAFRMLYRKAEFKDQAAFWIITVYGSVGEYEKAFQWATELQNPADQWRMRSMLSYHCHDREKAIAEAHKALRIDERDTAQTETSLNLVTRLFLGWFVWIHHIREYGPQRDGEIDQMITHAQWVLDRGRGGPAPKALRACAHALWGVALAEQGELEAAYRHCDKGLELDSNSSLIQFGKAWVHYVAGEYSQAEQCIRKGLKQSPGDAMFRTFLGGLLLLQGRPAEAIRELQQAITDDKNYAIAHIRLGWILALQGRCEEACTTIRNGIRLPPKNNWGRELLADVLLRQGRLQDARKTIDDAVVRAPQRPLGYIARGRIYRSLGDRTEATKSLCRALQLNPREIQAHQCLTQLLSSEAVRLRELDALAARLEELLAVPKSLANPQLKVPLLQTLALLRLHARGSYNLEKGLEHAQTAVKETQRRNPHTLATLAQIQFASGEQAEAVVTLEEALRLPRATLRHQELADDYRTALLQSHTVVSYTSIDAILASRKPPKDAEWLEAIRTAATGDIVTYVCGRIHQRAGKYVEAAEAFRTLAVDRSDKHPESHRRYAESLRDAGEPKAAAEHLRTVLAAGHREARELWNVWLVLCLVDLKQGPSVVLAGFPGGPAAGYGGDVHQLLQDLQNGAVRINCGGKDYESSTGTLWRQDRFFRGGIENTRDHLEITAAPDRALYQTNRSFPNDELGASYRIPLPAAAYLVRIHFAETWFRANEVRRFDVLLEGTPVLKELDIYREVGFAKPYVCTWSGRVTDGMLDIEFEPRFGNPAVDNDTPTICAIEVKRPD